LKRPEVGPFSGVDVQCHQFGEHGARLPNGFQRTSHGLIRALDLAGDTVFGADHIAEGPQSGGQIVQDDGYRVA
jgi:hypothetical protein